MSQNPLNNSAIFFFPSNDTRRKNLLAIGREAEFVVGVANQDSWSDLDEWLRKRNDWVFGFISYDAKNGIENLQTTGKSTIPVPHIHFIIPEHVVEWDDQTTFVHKGNWQNGFLDFERLDETSPTGNIELIPLQSKQEYLHAVHCLLQHIQQGDIYEVNYCQEFFAKMKMVEPFQFFRKLNALTEAPHSVYMKVDGLHLMCASPERFLSGNSGTLTSQPIKGTIKRGKTESEDNLRKQELYNSQKERSENVMIVDLVRNDLSKSSVKGSVQVTKLFGVQSFKTVHHLVSTIQSQVKPGTGFGRLMCDLFPMGSMTGAPKIRAMELANQYESSARGLYSGTVGYIKPDGDFDFNVVIRSLIYDDPEQKISCSVGGAITALCNPESEYEECLLKAEAMMKALK